MRLKFSLRFILPLGVVLALIAYGLAPFVDQLTLRWFVRDIEMRGELVSNAMQDSLLEALTQPSGDGVQRLFNRLIQDERIYAIGYCDPRGRLLFTTEPFPKEIVCPPSPMTGARSTIVEAPRGDFHVAFQPILGSGENRGQVVLVHDLSFAQKRSADSKAYLFYLLIGLGGVASLITVIVAQLSWRGWLLGIRAVLKGEGLFRPISHTEPEMRPLVRDLKILMRDLESNRRTRDENGFAWSPKALKEILQRDLAGDEVLIVSNREPYIHSKKGGQVEVKFPASGLVTALEPIMRACSGTWIAHGSGNADRETVDSHDRVWVPPNEPSYQIRRIWLSKEEEQGYYYGFANEGLWSLCHIAHVRPIFRSKDWEAYRAVNEKFARAVVEEAKTDDPIVLVQDYHLALLPRMIRERLPKATVITFWHIPFPNPEVFGICPWREELLEGLLGSDILGFHTQFHCNNFSETVDRFLESRIDSETSTISFRGSLTAINQYPISIEYPVKWMKDLPDIAECRRKVREANGLPPDRLLGVGVDRLDYTKGILERLLAVERLLEVEPTWVGKFTFLQIAAPSRTSIEQYQRFDGEVRALANRINKRFGREGYEPILLKIEHHEPPDVYTAFRASEVCVVSSLHDGMNLVAKEFIAARDDEQGVLILSQFTGASRELPEALIVNPYDIDQCAIALDAALRMTPMEQRDRMRSMRGLVSEFNVYRWAGRMLLDASRLRQRARLMRSLKSRGGPYLEVSVST